ncbi:MAG: nuclear transport factor 2 family protein [Actinomycetota bacterium]|nr:nuclear transport factor 2 family protein [Actinomycetota bacterium]
MPETTASELRWSAPSRAAHPARDAALASYDAVTRKDKQAWLANFAEDGWIEDPVGTSIFDKEGKGHHGAAGRANFWDITIGTMSRFVFEIRDSFVSGDECANVGTIHTTSANGWTASTDGVFVYKVDAAGKIVSLRAFWEMDRVVASAKPPVDAATRNT